MNSNAVLVQGVTFTEFRELISDIIDSKLERLPNPNQSITDFLTRKETAALLRISLPLLHSLTLQSTLKGYRISTRVLYKRSEVEDALTEIQSSKYRRA